MSEIVSLDLSEEDIIMRITVTRPVGTKEVILNFIVNLCSRAGGDVASKVHLILTNEALYLEYKGHCSIGFAEETRAIKKIPLKDIKTFDVTAGNGQELIRIEAAGKTFQFARANADGNDLAMAMKNAVQDS